MARKYTRSWFTRFAGAIARKSGHPWTFLAALAIILVWAATGPLFRFSDTWQLVINTGTTIITFLMVFLIQNTQNRDTEALQIKLDELIRAIQGAHNALLDLEQLDDSELVRIRRRYEQLAREARARLRRGGQDTDVPDLDDRELCEVSGEPAPVAVQLSVSDPEMPGAKPPRRRRRRRR
jgi:low affinity Fe/Cu permease